MKFDSNSIQKFQSLKSVKISELLILGLAIIWFLKTREIEPIIVIIPISIALLTSRNNRPFIDISLCQEGSGFKAVRIKNRIERKDVKIPTWAYDNIIVEREISWKIKVKIVNNSAKTAFKPELFVSDNHKHTAFLGLISTDIPIKSENKLELNFKYSKTINTDLDGVRKEHEKYWPSEIIEDFVLIIKYFSNDQIVYFTKFEFDNQEQTNSHIKKLPRGFSRALIQPT